MTELRDKVVNTGRDGAWICRGSCSSAPASAPPPLPAKMTVGLALAMQNGTQSGVAHLPYLMLRYDLRPASLSPPSAPDVVLFRDLAS